MSVARSVSKTEKPAKAVSARSEKRKAAWSRYVASLKYGLYVIDETNLESHGVWDAIVRGFLAPEDAVPGDRENIKGKDE